MKKAQKMIAGALLTGALSLACTTGFADAAKPVADKAAIEKAVASKKPVADSGMMSKMKNLGSGTLSATKCIATCDKTYLGCMVGANKFATKPSATFTQIVANFKSSNTCSNTAWSCKAGCFK